MCMFPSFFFTTMDYINAVRSSRKAFAVREFCSLETLGYFDK